MEIWRLSNWPKLTQLGSGRSRLELRTWPHGLHYKYYFLVLLDRTSESYPWSGRPLPATLFFCFIAILF